MMQRWTLNRKQNHPSHIEIKEKYAAESSGFTMSTMKNVNTTAVIIAVLVVGGLLTLVNIYEFHQMQKEHVMHLDIVDRAGVGSEQERKPVFVPYGKRLDSGYLKHVFAVFERLGYARGSTNSAWDVLWAHDYPFRQLQSMLKNLLPHQKVNHFPGSGYVTNKVSLATTESRYIPRAFKIPQDKDKLLEYAKIHPGIMFVQKSNNHRGIHIHKVGDLDLESEGSFVQEYISNPFLVDGYKFDIGIYTVLTSIDPLRVYVYEADVLFRFCPEKYNPFDPDNLDKYVVGDDYLPIWKVPSLEKYYVDLQFSMKESFNAFVRSQGRDPSKVWEGVNEAIRDMYLSKENQLIEAASPYKSTRNFFEMVRVDFVIDEELNVHVMEANMSPNLSSGHFPPNKLLYEQVIFNLLSLVGLGQRVHSDNLKPRPADEDDMEVALRNVVSFADVCAGGTCTNNCKSADCQLCRPCLTPEWIDILKMAYREHVNKQNCKRIFPPSIVQSKANRTVHHEGLSPKNQFMIRWFQGKCLMDVSWCS